MKIIAQAAVATIETVTLINEVGIRCVISTVLLAGVLSMLTFLAGLPELKIE